MAARVSLQRWLRTQALASQAEHDLLVAVASCLGDGSPKPRYSQIAKVQRLRRNARAGWAQAMAQVVLQPQELPSQQLEHRARLQLQYVLGTQHVFQSAMLALIETHSDKDLLRGALGRLLARRSEGVQEPGPDNFEQGVADAQNLIRVATLMSPDPG